MYKFSAKGKAMNDFRHEKYSLVNSNKWRHKIYPN